MLRFPLLFLLSLAVATSAASLPSTIAIFVPANGTQANSTVSELRSFGFSETTDLPSGIFRRNISLTVLLPNGTRQRGGSVSSSTCPTLGESTKYTSSFDSAEAGVYVVEVNTTYGLPAAGGDCRSPFTFQSSFTSVAFELSAPALPGGGSSGSSNPVTTTAQLMPNPTGSFQVSSAMRVDATILAMVALIGLAMLL